MEQDTGQEQGASSRNKCTLRLSVELLPFLHPIPTMFPNHKCWHISKTATMDLPSATIPSHYCQIQGFMGLKTKTGCQSLALPGLRWSKHPGRPMATHTRASGSSAESQAKAEPSLAKQTDQGPWAHVYGPAC